MFVIINSVPHSFSTFPSFLLRNSLRDYVNIWKKKCLQLPNNQTTSFSTTFCVLLLNFLTFPTYISCTFITAPYGRHFRTGWGPTLLSWVSWALMESPTLFISLITYSFGRHVSSPRSLSLLAVYLTHYTHRTIIYPLLHLRRKTASGFPVSVAVLAFLFNVLNVYVQIRWVSHYGEYDSDKWFWARFWAGLVVFGLGMVVNVKADYLLLGLKAQSGGEGYRIPRGGVFELVSCGNYFGEIVEWLGWAIMCWSWAGFGFFLYTCSNLVPRAVENHRWYLEKFKEEYPKNRKAVIPYLY